MDTSAYPYQSLDLPIETRILTVSPGDFNDELICSLSHMPISSQGDHEPYDALSYCWSGSVVTEMPADPNQIVKGAVYGKENGRTISLTYEMPLGDMLDHDYWASTYIRQGLPLPPGPIIIDGVQVTISGELRRALQRLRGEDFPLRIWVDALCINQLDFAERNEHVRMMGVVYENAARVRVWLGEEIGIEVELMRTFDIINQLFDELFVERRLLERGASAIEIQSHWAREELSRQIEWPKLAELVDRAWFHRTWIIQEIVNAREITVHIGQFKLPWENMVVPLTGLRQFRLDGHISDYKGAKAIAVMDMLRRERVGDGLECSSLPLLTLLEEVRDFRSTIASDKIYGVVGMTKHKMAVDYTKTSEQVFIELAAQYLHSGSLDILCHCVDVPGKPPTALELPSWVPDWTTSGWVEPLYIRGLRANACGTTTASLTTDLPTGTLRIRGRLLDTLEVVGVKKQIPKTRFEYSRRIPEQGPMPEFDPDPAHHNMVYDEALVLNDNETHRELLQIALPHMHHAGCCCSELGALSHTMMCGRTRDNEVPEAGAVLAGFETFMASHIHGESAARVLQRKADQEAEERGLAEDEAADFYDRQKEAYEMVSGAYSKWCFARRFCKSEGGRYGWVVDGTRPGDVVAVFYGAKFPLVLREDEELKGSYRIIGDCYMHGLMDGEAVAEEHVGREMEFCVI
ncbi:heterokaryon incompatibility protein-domain-containing protein [Lasiosphaeris hirsuta]|uniref:Heterokaryon incompatibility protein-domain-containing protein n=1 Tax=Lasiosphaeris hirsuta TaxID=260670 RepID=A0AA40A9W2_9PEZI|nr:heterokaryon incompatibility protein-domain-containing protein [Lasiosphaeris hirsuta]